MEKAIVLILDGVGDLPDSVGLTPLAAARTPNMDALTKEGATGLYSSIGRGLVPGSDTSHLNIFGYDYCEYYVGRGPLEALGAGVELKEGDIALRTNFATVKGGKVVDRRAGRIPTAEGRSLEKYISKMKMGGVQVLFKSTVEHRGVLIMRGRGLSPFISPTDTHELGNVVGVSKPLKKGAKDKKAADVLNKFTKLAMKKLEKAKENEGKKLPANAVIARGAGAYRKVPSIGERFGIKGACVAGGALYKGVAAFVGMDVLNVKGATGTKDTNLLAKGNAAVKALGKNDYVFLHVKATDSFSHDGGFEGKKRMIERVDVELMPLLRECGGTVVITGDHSTPVRRKNHSGHSTPLLINGPDVRPDMVGNFSEKACMRGGLGHVQGTELMHMVLNYMDKGRMVGT